MPKIKPIDRPEHKRKIFLIKATFLGLIVLLVVFMNVYLANRPISPPPLKKDRSVALTSSNILGAKTQEELVIGLKKEIGEIRKQLENVLGTATKQGEAIFDETSENATDTAIDAVFDTAVVPVITQIQNLPIEQQDQIREAICR